jgi:hypothetical protein
MGHHNALSDSIPHAGRGKRIAVLVAIVMVVVALIAVVTSGFHGRQIQRNADAITDPVTRPLGTPPPGGR